jgi:hypothetical protein
LNGGGGDRGSMSSSSSLSTLFPGGLLTSILVPALLTVDEPTEDSILR